MPYPGHPKGCPTLNKKQGCPPTARPLHKQIVSPYFAIINEFDLARHTRSMSAKHPQWTERQVRCCLYWQRKARKELESLIESFLGDYAHIDMDVERCPEACGLNVTETLRHHGVRLEWPPVNIVRQVAIAGVKAELMQ